MQRTSSELLARIARGRTDLVCELLAQPDWQEALRQGPTRALQWFVYYGDATALAAVLHAGGDLSTLDLDVELRNAAFAGHFKVCDLLLAHGADVRAADPDTGETALHGALTKANRPHYLFTVRLLLERGADVGARTIAGRETGAFARDVRTRGETALHRAAAYADPETIELLLAHGADREARDAHGASPLTWASEHLRPGAVLALLAFGEHRIGEAQRQRWTSDHGAGFGNGLERNLLGDYLPESGGAARGPAGGR